MTTITIEGADPAKVSDGYHTFEELYEHRCLLFAALMLSNRELSWRSQQHHDGSGYEGWFIAGMRLPAGSVTYHMPMKLWGMLFPVETLERAPEWDGHTSADVLQRLRHSFSGQQGASRAERLRNALSLCSDELVRAVRGSTHWAGCEQEHHACRAIKIAREALGDE